MSLASAVRTFFSERSESHAISYQDVWGRGDRWDPVNVHAGVPVSQESALRLSVVWRCVRLISETLAALPAEAVRAVGNVRQPVDRPPRWLEMPNPETNWFEFAERIYESLLMDGNAFILITGRDATGYPAELWTLHPSQVAVRKREGRVQFVWEGNTVLSRYGPTNPAGDVLHIRLASAGGLRGLSPIEAARQSIGLGLVTEKFGARFFGKGQQMSGVIQLPADQPARSREHIELMKDSWEEAHAGSDRAHRPAVLTGGATWQGITIPPEDAQFLQTRSFQVEDIASRFFGVPPNFVGLTEKQTSWGTGLQEQSLAFLRFTLLPHLVRFETAFTSLLPRGQFTRLNQRALLRADMKTEAEVLAMKLQNGVINFNRWLELEDEPPRPGGNRYMIPANMELLEPSGEKTEPAVPASTPEPTPSPNGNGRVTVPVGGE